ncbi:unnamed protein product [Euphydryas editha]|uniref:Uncharacterized protein n=1 Tax=Euphydryas editha TaxID=104508 RepID=A0AAU9UJA1_EUPED|nr:unnamed protein product [Euphydryas editha]
MKDVTPDICGAYHRPGETIRHVVSGYSRESQGTQSSTPRRCDGANPTNVPTASGVHRMRWKHNMNKNVMCAYCWAMGEETGRTGY